MTKVEGDDGFPVPVDSGGTVHVQTPVNGVDEEVEMVQIPVDEEGDAVQVKVDEGADVTKDDTSGNEIHVWVDEEADLAKDDEGGDGVHVQVYDERVQVDEETELAKEVGPAEGPKTKEDILMAKQDWFAHGGEGGIVKSAAAAPSLLVANAGSFGHVASTSSFCQQSSEWQHSYVYCLIFILWSFYRAFV